jgi:hypothetical protein
MNALPKGEGGKLYHCQSKLELDRIAPDSLRWLEFVNTPISARQTKA